MFPSRWFLTRSALATSHALWEKNAQRSQYYNDLMTSYGTYATMSRVHWNSRLRSCLPVPTVALPDPRQSELGDFANV